MSRIIKFKAWQLERKQMYQVGNLVFRNNWIGASALNIETGLLSDTLGINYFDKHLPDEFILLQFTGLKDKNGVEIYEGDIIKWDDNSNGKYWRVCQIIWEKAHYELVGYTFYSSDPADKHPVKFKFGAFIYENDDELEVIGNIYENPELLNN